MPRPSLRKLLAAATLVVTTGSALGGCYMHPRDAHNLATAVIWTAAIIGHVAILAAHDAHMHYEHCGHYRRWHEDRWVYYYEERWEYYDDGDGRWYYYEE